MVNTSEFIKRLQKVMEFYGLTPASLADELRVQRSSISHLLSERNKPSLEFLLKLTTKFPEVDIYWIALGRGNFPQKAAKNANAIPKTMNFLSELENKKNTDNQVFSHSENREKPEKKEIEKIIFFFTDKSFEIFENK